MFMEPCLGGELWISLKANKRFNESRTQFYVACIIEAIEVKLVNENGQYTNLISFFTSAVSSIAISNPRIY